MTGTEAAEVVARLGKVTRMLDGVRIPALGTVKASGVWGLDGSLSAKAWLVRTTPMRPMGASPSPTGTAAITARPTHGSHDDDEGQPDEKCSGACVLALILTHARVAE